MSKSTKSAKSTPKSKKLSHAQRSAISRRAAANAWKTMRSKAYIRAANKSKKAVQTFLANRAA